MFLSSLISCCFDWSLSGIFFASDPSQALYWVNNPVTQIYFRDHSIRIRVVLSFPLLASGLHESCYGAVLSNVLWGQRSCSRSSSCEAPSVSSWSSSPPSSSIYAGAQEIQFMTWFVQLSSSGTSFAQTLIEERAEIVLFKQ